jgi:hypothetical protein
VASFSIHFEPRFEPLGWLCALYSSAAGRKNLSPLLELKDMASMRT